MKIDSSSYFYINSSEWGDVVLIKRPILESILSANGIVLIPAKAVHPPEETEMPLLRLDIKEMKMDVMGEYFNEWLISIMKKYKITQKKLSELASTPQPYISNLIKNQGRIPKIKTRTKIKDAIINNYIIPVS